MQLSSGKAGLSACGDAQAGFTLIELILVITLIGIMAASTAMMVLQGTQAYADLIGRKESLHNARLAMERISREIRTATTASKVSSTKLRIDGGALDFFHDSATNTIKVDPGGYVLAEGITSLTISDDNTNDWIGIELTEAGGQRYRTKAYLRKEIFYP